MCICGFVWVHECNSMCVAVRRQLTEVGSFLSKMSSGVWHQGPLPPKSSYQPCLGTLNLNVRMRACMSIWGSSAEIFKSLVSET